MSKAKPHGKAQTPMPTPILSTKIYIPTRRHRMVVRPRLIKQLNEGLNRKLTLVSAPAGFGKTTLVSDWLDKCDRPVAWLSLDEGDNDPIRFLTYIVVALQTIAPTTGVGVLKLLHSPQAPSMEAILTLLLNEIATIPEHFILVLDDYHSIDTTPIHHALIFLLAHLPPQMHLVLATREDPPLPLARLRVRNYLTELRVADLRFTSSEAAEFFKEVMGLQLSEATIVALENRTEGWIAGLQLAGISMQGLADPTTFVRSFTGSHHFVLDYLVEEVLQQQSDPIQKFLLYTSISDRLCGALCDAVLLNPSATGQTTLESIERANLFIIPLDNERRWYRYHHLFTELLRQRLHHSLPKHEIEELHRRASLWFEANVLEMEAFHHAVAANDIERAGSLIEGAGMPLYFRGAALPVLKWLESLPGATLDAHPALWVTYASVLLFASQIGGVEAKLQAAERVLLDTEPTAKTRDLLGHIASIRATVAVTQHDVETIVIQSRRALDFLHPANLPVRTATTWTMGYAYHLQGERAAAYQAYTEALAVSETIGHFIIRVMATLGIGHIHQSENRLYTAAETYQRVLHLIGEPPLPVACQAHLGLARIYYEWNDLDRAIYHTHQSIQLARQLQTTDRVVAVELFLARLHLARGELSAATEILQSAEAGVRQHTFIHQIPELVATQVLVLLRGGKVESATSLAQSHDLPIIQARVLLAQGKPSVAVPLLASVRHHVEAKGWVDERLKVLVVEAVAHYQNGDMAEAFQRLEEALIEAEPHGCIRIFVDEGKLMAELFASLVARGVNSDYIHTILTAFNMETSTHHRSPDQPLLPSPQPLIEPLSQREVEVLHLIAQGFSNHEIGQRLFLALNTVKGHNQKIFGKLQVLRRTEAVARARELGLL